MDFIRQKLLITSFLLILTSGFKAIYGLPPFKSDVPCQDSEGRAIDCRNQWCSGKGCKYYYDEKQSTAGYWYTVADCDKRHGRYNCERYCQNRGGENAVSPGGNAKAEYGLCSAGQQKCKCAKQTSATCPNESYWASGQGCGGTWRDDLQPDCKIMGPGNTCKEYKTGEETCAKKCPNDYLDSVWSEDRLHCKCK